MKSSKILSGVYQYEFKSAPSKKYIGSSIDLNKRNIQHISHLKRAKHNNLEFLEDYTYFGHADLIYSVLEFVDNTNFLNCNINKESFLKQLLKVEQKYLDLYYAQEYIKDKKDIRFLQYLYNKNPLAEINASFIHCKSVYQYDLDGIFVKEWPCIRDAEHFYKKSYGGINKAFNKNSSYCAEFQWSLKKVEKMEPTHHKNKIYQYSLDKELIQSYTTLDKARSNSGIYINKNFQTSGGFYWLKEGESFEDIKNKLYSEEIKEEIKKLAFVNKNKNLKSGDLQKLFQPLMEKYNAKYRLVYSVYHRHLKKLKNEEL